MSSSEMASGADKVIEVNSVSKYFRKETPAMLSEVLTAIGTSAMKALRHRSTGARRAEKGFWALSDVSFSVNRGEIVGIVGNNGAGKSTLLKILSQITPPSKGSIRFTGRVGSLLEVGTGFHPDLSGRENVFLNGAILGMGRREIAQQFDEIVAFAGVEPFIDTPVKHYSSGMYMRLAFAVAAHLETDILLIDEVLAVGDVNFQKKCIDRMSNVARSGRTILFVSHNLTAIQSLCHRTLWFDSGRLAEDGDTDKVISSYLRMTSGGNGLPQQAWDDLSTAPGDATFRLRRVSIAPASGRAGDPVSIGEPFELEVEYWNGMPDADLNVSWSVHNAEGILLFDAGNWEIAPRRRVGFYRERCRIPADLMNEGTISLSLDVTNSAALIHQFPRVITCELLDSDNGRHGWYGTWHGTFRPRFEWSVTEIDSK